MSVNKVILVGNVGKDPEIKHLDSEISVANFPLATSESYTNKAGEKVTNTEWHNIVCWRGLATICEKYVKKGRQLYIEGRIKTRSYDAQDGSKRYITEIYANSVELLGRGDSNDSNAANQQPPMATNTISSNQAAVNTRIDNDAEDDLPF